MLIFHHCIIGCCQSFSSDVFSGKWWFEVDKMSGDTTTYYYSNSQCIYINHIRARNAFYVGIKPYYLSDAILSSFDLTKCGHVTNGKFMYKPKLYFELKSASNDIVVLKPKRYTSERVTGFISDDICLKTLSNKPRFDDLYYFTDYNISLSKQCFSDVDIYDKLLSLSLCQRLISGYNNAQQLSLYNSLCSGFKKYTGTSQRMCMSITDMKNFMDKLFLKYTLISTNDIGDYIKSRNLVLCTLPTNGKTYVIVGEVKRYPKCKESKTSYISIDPATNDFIIFDKEEIENASIISYSCQNSLNSNDVNSFCSGEIKSVAFDDYILRVGPNPTNGKIKIQVLFGRSLEILDAKIHIIVHPSDGNGPGIEKDVTKGDLEIDISNYYLYPKGDYVVAALVYPNGSLIPAQGKLRIVKE